MAGKFTITGNIADHLPGDARRVKAVARLNIGPGEAVIDKTTNQIITPVVPVTINTDGSFAASGLVDTAAADLNVVPNTLRWSLEFSWVDLTGKLSGRVDRQTKAFRWFTVTADSTLASHAAELDTPATAPIWRDEFRSTMETLRTEVLEHTEVLTAPANTQVATYLGTPGDAQDAAREQAAVAAARMRDPLAVWRGRLAMRQIVPAVMGVGGGSPRFGATPPHPLPKGPPRPLYPAQAGDPARPPAPPKPPANACNRPPPPHTQPGAHP